jgi:hypothetical protein
VIEVVDKDNGWMIVKRLWTLRKLYYDFSVGEWVKEINSGCIIYNKTSAVKVMERLKS